MPSQALKQSKKAENDVSSILLKFSRWLPLTNVIKLRVTCQRGVSNAHLNPNAFLELRNGFFLAFLASDK